MNPRLSPSDLEHIVTIRHDLHAHPELGYQEHRTSEVVQQELTRLGIEFKAGLGRGTGVLAHIPATVANAETVAIRADMDALPIQENTGKPYASQTANVMHACGHDGHTAILLGAATVLSRAAERPNNLLLIFQPAEEGGAGGKAMCEDGVLDGSVLGEKASRIFGLHGHSATPLGHVATCVGPMLAATDSFHARLIGKGGHAAMPHTSVDPIVIASQIVSAWQTIASRNVDPLDSVVVTCGEFHAGVAHNVIPDAVELTGTIRTLRDETRSMAVRRFKEIAEGIAASFGAKFVCEWTTPYPVTRNDAESEGRFRAALADFSGEVEKEPCLPTMGGEDFSFYGAHAKACFYWLGLNPKPDFVYPNLHAPEFDFNDDAIPYGVEAMCRLALAT